MLQLGAATLLPLSFPILTHCYWVLGDARPQSSPSHFPREDLLALSRTFGWADVSQHMTSVIMDPDFVREIDSFHARFRSRIISL